MKKNQGMKSSEAGLFNYYQVKDAQCIMVSWWRAKNVVQEVAMQTRSMRLPVVFSQRGVRKTCLHIISTWKCWSCTWKCQQTFSELWYQIVFLNCALSMMCNCAFVWCFCDLYAVSLVGQVALVKWLHLLKESQRFWIYLNSRDLEENTGLFVFKGRLSAIVTGHLLVCSLKS